MRTAGTLERNAELVSPTPMMCVLAVGPILGFRAPVICDAATTAATGADELANIGAPFALILIGISIIDVVELIFP